MKNLLSLVAAFAITTTANAGWITSAQSFTDKEIKTEKRSLDTYGLNPRAYIFNIGKDDGADVHMTCIIVYTEQNLGESKNGGKSTAPVMQCVKF